MSVLYTTKFPPDLNKEADIELHKSRMAEGSTGLALGGGTVLRYVEFAPGYQVRNTYHRDSSFDLLTIPPFSFPHVLLLPKHPWQPLHLPRRSG